VAIADPATTATTTTAVTVANVVLATTIVNNQLTFLDIETALAYTARAVFFICSVTKMLKHINN
jgi:hypothetical protein